MEWERVITHSIMAIMGALATLGGALFVFLRKGKESEIAAGADIRDELRKELREVKAERKRLKEQYEDELASLRDERDEIAEERKELQEERLKLKRGLDIRDHRISMLEARVAELEIHSQPEEF